MSIVMQLRQHGLRVSATGEKLMVKPASALTDSLRTIIRTHKADILRELGHNHEPRPDFDAALKCSRRVACIACQHFQPRPGERPDGWCMQFKTETWGKAPFLCDGYVERRQ